MEFTIQLDGDVGKLRQRTSTVPNLRVSHGRGIVFDPVEEILLVLPLWETKVAVFKLRSQNVPITGLESTFPVPVGLNPSFFAINSQIGARCVDVIIHYDTIRIEIMGF